MKIQTADEFMWDGWKKIAEAEKQTSKILFAQLDAERSKYRRLLRHIRRSAIFGDGHVRACSTCSEIEAELAKE